MRIRVGGNESGDGGAELTGRFADWLARDRSVGRHVTMTRERSATADGGMSGDLLEWIGLTLSTGFSAAGLIYSHLNFRASLPPRQRPGAQMVVEHNGVRLVIEEGSAEDAARLVRLLGTTTATPGGDAAGRAGSVDGEDTGEGAGGDS
ncbi:effector-associated constant component EACC1 [Streptomyces johnsoniae]|uniref:Uncharacterized protein n=1 Tax=Streptomyces johnsoniae TaxID=3075532 RepID=A0ABU2S6J0_9ACTN|nr:hypothetical protein [Streptomyces sp. DSM 41886]MDT0444049.1 hypothetical protein [Streptomyces sp. DSM 41886]